MLAPGQAVAASCSDTNANPATTSISKVEAATRCLINNERTTRGLSALRSNSKLAGAARKHSEDMVRRRFFSHTNPDGKTFVDRIRATGYLTGNWRVGENIAWGTYSYATPKSVVQGWMNSSGHRANILSTSYRDIGVGVAKGVPTSASGPGGTYTTDFGKHG